MKARTSILLIEDNPLDASMVRQALQMRGFPFRLVTASTGEEALDLLEQGEKAGANPDVILLDLYLPGMEGKRVLDRIRAKPDLKAVPVIVITASDSKADREAVLSAGADEFFGKPREVSAFMRIGKLIEDVLHQRKAADESQ